MRNVSALASIANGFAALAPQIVALILLPPTEFGQFSIIYLIYAFGISVSLSTISEPWHIRKIERLGFSERSFAIASATVSIIVATVTFVLGLFLGTGTNTSAVAGVATGLAVYRANARYYLVQQRQLSRALSIDSTFTIAFATIVILATIGQIPTLFAVYGAWATSGLFATLLVPWPRGRGSSPLTWIRGHWIYIRRLLSDSILMDVGAIFTPALIAPSLGTAGFGTYRAVSNVAAPVRLILNPLRPQITAQRVAARSVQKRNFRLILVGAVALAAAAALTLEVVDQLSWQVGVLNSLAPYVIPVALTIAANFVGHYSYIRGRTRLTGRALLTARLVQTALVSILPLAGATIFSVSGAIWGAAMANVLVAVLWSSMVNHQSAQ